jgi:hypothetical protein
MHLDIVLTLGNSPATECVSLIAQRTRQDRDGAPQATWPEVGCICEVGLKALLYLLSGASVQCSVFSVQCSVFSVQCSVFSVQCSVSGERKCGMRLVASGMCVRDSALRSTHCAIR